MKSKSLVLVSLLLVVLGWAGSSQAAFYSITGGGGQAAVGGGLPLPIQPSTIGGMNFGTMTAFPPLLIPVNPAAPLVEQTGAAPMKMKVKPGSFLRKAPGPTVLGVAPNNPTVFQVKTNIAFSGPAPAWGTATFSAGGRTGLATDTFTGVPTAPLPSQIRYKATAAQFGGPSRTKIVPATTIEVWAHGPAAMAPCKHTAYGGPDAGCVALMVEAHPMTLAVAGAAVASPNDTTPGGFVMTKGVRAASVASKGTILMDSVILGMSAPISNMATSDGFPWTTGRVSISQPSAAGAPELFILTGMDLRTAMGVGEISLVSGALSNRTTSGPNSNRSWARYNLPEPGAVLGAAAALAMLGVCHGLVRRRSR